MSIAADAARGRASGTRGSARAPPAAPAATRVAAASADDHVELAPARDLGAARDVDRAQLDRRPRQRAHDRARRRSGRPAAAATRARRGSRPAGRTPPRRPAGGRSPAPRAPTATAWPSWVDLGDEHRDLARRGAASRAISRSMSTATDCAWARSLAQRQNSTARRRRRRAARRARRPRASAPSAPRRAATTGRGQRTAARASATHRASPRRRRSCRSRCAPAPRKRRSAASGSPATVSARRAELPRQRRRGQVELLRVVDQQVVEAGGAQRRPRARASAQRVDDQVARRRGRRPRRSIRSWAAVDLRRTRARARRPARRRLSAAAPSEVLLGADQLGLEPVDPPDEAAEQRVGRCRRSRGGAATARRSARPASPAGRRRRAARSCRPARRARRSTSAASSAGVSTSSSLVARGQARLEPGAQRRGARRRSGPATAIRSGSQPCADEPAEARLERRASCPSRPRRARAARLAWVTASRCARSVRRADRSAPPESRSGRRRRCCARVLAHRLTA